MLEKHWQHWQSVGKFANVLPTLPTDGQHWPDLACLLGNCSNFKKTSYSDDSVLTLSHKNVTWLQSKLNFELSKINIWLKSYQINCH